MSRRFLLRACGVAVALCLVPLAPARAGDAQPNGPLVFNGDIAFVHGGSSIQAVYRNGTLRRTLTTGNDPTYSADGRKIVYSVGTSIWVMNADGTNRRRVIDTGETLTGLDWSPDGTGFAWRQSFDGNKQRVRALRFLETTPRTLFGGSAESVDNAVWTPDNKILAGLYQYVPQINFDVVDRSGAARTNVAWGVSRAKALDVAPDGRIVLAEERYVYVQNGSNFDHFGVDGTGSIGDVAVSPDGMWVAFSRVNAGTNTGLWLSRLDGTSMRRLTTGADTQPTWRPITSHIPNQPPNVVASVTRLPQQTISVDASASLDLDGRITRWRWTFGDDDGVIETPATTHHYAAPGTYFVELTITDNLGATTTRGTWVAVPAD